MLSYSEYGERITVFTNNARRELENIQTDLDELLPNTDLNRQFQETASADFQTGVTFTIDDERTAAEFTFILETWRST